MTMFEVDREGLRQILARRGKEFAIFELVQNAWDQNVTNVTIELRKERGDRYVSITVTDDDPDGFSDIRHAYTLFAPSEKKGNATQRGRFNIGEKLVIAACSFSRITTTTGCYEFYNLARKRTGSRTAIGSIFYGEMLMTREEYDSCSAAVRSLIPPIHIKTYFNGELLAPRVPFKIVEGVPLRTEIADADGYLRATTRKSDIQIFECRDGEKASVYEMGIPVVETGDQFHVNVMQKVPLSMERDNITPAYRRTLRTHVLNATSADIKGDDATETWIGEALESPDVSREAVTHIVTQRYGDRAVVRDPSDPESNNRAVAAGYTVVQPRAFNKEQWTNVRAAEVLPPAGRLFPTHPEGIADDVIELEPNAEEQRVFRSINRLAEAMLGFRVTIRYISSRQVRDMASYGGRVLMFNQTKLGKKFLHDLSEPVIDLVIHEFGHEFESNHLTDRYNNTLTRLGAKLAFLVKADPTLLEVQ